MIFGLDHKNNMYGKLNSQQNYKIIWKRGTTLLMLVLKVRAVFFIMTHPGLMMAILDLTVL